MFKPKAGNDYFNAVRKYRAGAKLQDLAKEYGITRVGMYYALKKHGVDKLRDERAKISSEGAIELRKSGKKLKDIAQQYNCSVPAVSIHLNRKMAPTKDLVESGVLDGLEISIQETIGAFREFQKDCISEVAEQEIISIEDTEDLAMLDEIENVFAGLKDNTVDNFVEMANFFPDLSRPKT